MSTYCGVNIHLAKCLNGVLNVKVLFVVQTFVWTFISSSRESSDIYISHNLFHVQSGSRQISLENHFHSNHCHWKRLL